MWGLLATCAACTAPAPRPEPRSVPAAAAPPSASTDAAAAAANVGVDLPAGLGRDILLTSCVSCHDLGGLKLFKGFYTRDRWQELVLTMVGNGAAVGTDEIDVLTDYLTQHFGPETR